MKIYNDMVSSNFLHVNNRKTFINFRANNFKTIAKTSHIIDNSLSASLDLPTQDTVVSIYKKLKGLKKYFGRTNFQKANEMRSKYPSIESKPVLRGGYSFTLTEGAEKDKTISIVRSKNASDILRLVVSNNDEAKSSTHYLIRGTDKVVSNINQKYPFMTPPKFRFMTAKEISDCGIVKYLGIIENELAKYHDFLQSDGKMSEAKTSSDEKVPYRKPYLQRSMRVSKSYAEMASKVFDIFDNGPEKLPSHINASVGPTSGKVLIINFVSDAGDNIKLTKTMSAAVAGQLKYLSVASTDVNGEKKYLAIDTATKKFLKVDSKNGKPIVPDEAPLFYTTAEVEKAGLNEFFENVYSQIFKENSNNEVIAEQKVEVLKIKEPVKVVDIDDPEYEPLDFEEKGIEKLLEKTLEEENGSVIEKNIQNEPVLPKKRGRKPKALTTQLTEGSSIVTPPKKRGRKPKVQQQVIQPKENNSQTVEIGSKFDSYDLDKFTNIEQIKQKILNKAEQDAAMLSDLYINTLLNKFKENLEGAASTVMEKLSEILKFNL